MWKLGGLILSSMEHRAGGALTSMLPAYPMRQDRLQPAYTTVCVALRPFLYFTCSNFGDWLDW
jgi:hypothetical protein